MVKINSLMMFPDRGLHSCDETCWRLTHLSQKSKLKDNVGVMKGIKHGTREYFVGGFVVGEGYTSKTSNLPIWL